MDKLLKDKIGLVVESYYKAASTFIVIRDIQNDSKFQIEVHGCYDVEFGDEIVWRNKSDCKIFWYSFKLKQTKELNKIVKIKSILK